MVWLSRLSTLSQNAIFQQGKASGLLPMIFRRTKLRPQDCRGSTLYSSSALMMVSLEGHSSLHCLMRSICSCRHLPVQYPKQQSILDGLQPSLLLLRPWCCSKSLLSATVCAFQLALAYDFKLGVFVGVPNQKFKDATDGSNACGRET